MAAGGTGSGRGPSGRGRGYPSGRMLHGYGMSEPAPASPQAIEMAELTLRFGSFTAVDQIDCRVAHGEIFGLLGANGAGKTSTIKVLTTLLPPSSGHAKVAGFDVVEFPAEV